ncbi:MAG: YgiT-type zinc finger protein [Nanoarchaeota archaeon]|nr:YgiT-type zinc finger protein [Nanoarchaeota archaeon]MBU1005292.1 YgiT-type zinc finger protein [Nanoarchaeota archaeon]MBU1946223.1 YgiT-type zinc finger protein [Nanoarchaeota archaeon]
MKKCPICEKGNLIKRTVPYFVYEVKIGDFPAEVCTKCGEQWFSEETAKEIEKIEKEKGLFGLSKHSKIGYSGNSLIVRIPTEIAKFMNLKKETPVCIHPEGKNKILIEV